MLYSNHKTQDSGSPLTLKSVNFFSVVAQSATTTTVHASNTMHTVVDTRDLGRSTAIDDAYSSDADISKFLTRRVQIQTFTWSNNTALSVSFNPWEDFLSNPAVTNKLQNFNLIKGDLKVTFLINGTPFHAGIALASYSYLNRTNEFVTVGGDTQLITQSQRPHIFLNASTCKGGCVCLPFFVPQNYLSLTNPIISASSMGRINIGSFADLVQINGGTDAVTITVFAEMSNVKLSVPTMVAVSLSGSSSMDFSYFELESQAGDEYEDSGVISGPASAVAAYAGYFTNIPYIQPFALATQIGASAVSGIAKIFGFSRPVMLDDIRPMRNFPISSLALAEGSDTSQKLTVTGKQEMSIDPRIVELPPDDTLTIKYMTQIESYLTQFSWATSADVGDVIFACQVNPMCEIRTTVAGGSQIIPTALSFASRPFENWSGSIKYRFQIIASQYHRGRLAIIYDPNGPLTGDPYNTTFNTIVDLADGRDFTVEFKWQQERGYLTIDTDNFTTFFDTATPATYSNSSKFSNGVFFIRVVNELVVPDSVTPVTVLVSIAAGDDFELVNPSDFNINVSPFVPVAQSSSSDFSFDYFDIECQSATEEVPEQENAPEADINVMDLTTGVMTHEMQKPLIYYGEKIVSFRQLLKRYCLCRTFGFSTTSTELQSAIFLLRAMPPVGGFDPAGPDTTAATTPYMYAGPNFINYLKGAYAGWRGSIRWKFAPNTDVKSIMVSRRPGEGARLDPANLRPELTINYARNQGSGFTAYEGLLARDHCSSGAALTQCRTMDALEVEIPMAIESRFCGTLPQYYAAALNSITRSYPGGDTFVVTVFGNQTAPFFNMDTYVAAGEDFTLLGWIGAPVFYSSDLPVSA
jgi:hypothetical protein